jgi:hypothetical protein
LIEPLGYKSEVHEKLFREERNNTYNRFTKEFIVAFCNKDGSINWTKLVEFVSGNLP